MVDIATVPDIRLPYWALGEQVWPVGFRDEKIRTETENVNKFLVEAVYGLLPQVVTCILSFQRRWARNCPISFTGLMRRLIRQVCRRAPSLALV
jgi:hypothetical protein